MRRPRIPGTGAAITFAVLCGLAVVVWLIWMVVTGAAEREELRHDVQGLNQTVDLANDRLVEAGEKPVTPPEPGEQGIPGTAGQAGRAPTTAEILGAVTAYCTDNPCRGPAGRNVTQAQVAAAVSAYCNDRGECRGPRGGDGNDGADGSDGRPGAQGPPPSDAQVAQAVAAFCADGRCRGPVGPTGATGSVGERGATGVGVDTVELQQTNVPTECDLIVTYTDGTIHNAGRVTCPTDTQGQG